MPTQPIVTRKCFCYGPCPLRCNRLVGWTRDEIGVLAASLNDAIVRLRGQVLT